MRALVPAQLLSAVALAEFRSGDAERGRALFEGILRNYPRRLDLWSVYLDQASSTVPVAAACTPTGCILELLAAAVGAQLAGW